MMQERKALGKGLGSLIPLGNRSESNKNYFDCDLIDIIPNANQPRKLFDKTAIDELAASIEEKGILQPLVVRRMGGGKYEIVAGERRFRAAQLLNLEKVPVIVKDVADEELLELALIENIQRENLNPIEEALAFKELLSKFQYTQDELAKRLGKDRSSITNTLRLLKLPENIRADIIAGKISMGHARALLAIEDADIQTQIAQKIVAENLSVRDIESLVRRFRDEPVVVINQDNEEEKTEEMNVGITESTLKNLENDLRNFFKTRIQIKSSGEKGKIVVHYHSKEELDRLYQLIVTK